MATSETGEASPATTDEQRSVIYDDVETSLGISKYMSPTVPGFSAVMKARFSDFLVHEVGLDGTIARLTSRDLPKTETPKDQDTPSTEPKQEISQTDTSVSEDTKSLEKQLEDMIQDATIAKNVMAMLEKHNSGAPCDEKFVSLPALEKAQRKAVHGWIREKLLDGRADTLEGRIRIWHVKFEKEMPNYNLFKNNRGDNKRGRNDKGGGNRNKRAKISWPENRPNFLQFVLYKENMDTTTATKDLSRKGGKARIGYAGMKDKRGITTQFCTMYQTEPERILAARQAGGGTTKLKGYGVVQVGNFEYVSQEMRLGTLKGNRFDLVLRNVQTSCTDPIKSKAILEEAAQAMKDFGFINYFGTQRFGKYKDTHLVGIAVLQGDFQKGIDTLMAPKPDDRSDVAEGRKEWQNRFQNGQSAEQEAASAKRVIKSLNRFMTAENSAMQVLSRFPQNYKKAFTSISKTLRMMFLHAVQSLVWNRAASHRIQLSKTDALVGDLVRKGDEIHVVTEDDKANKAFTIEDVVLPLIGTKSQYPTNEMESVMKQLLSDIGVTVEMFKKIQDRDLALKGDYRNLMCRPQDFDFEIKEYYDPKQPLLQTDLMKLNGEEIEITPPDEENKEKKVAMMVGFTLPASSYATIAMRELLKRPTSTDYQKDLKL